MLREFTRLHLLGAEGLQTAGVPIIVDGAPTMLFARLTNLLSDGDGFRLAYDWKASSSLKPCLRHWNVVKKADRLLRVAL